MDVPNQWSEYPCSDYFQSELAQTGLWDEPGQWFVIVPASEAKEHAKIAFLEVGRAGTDGILFGYRKGMPGVWVYYPIGHEFEKLASTFPEFVEKWHKGSIVV